MTMLRSAALWYCMFMTLNLDGFWLLPQNPVPEVSPRIKYLESMVAEWASGATKAKTSKFCRPRICLKGSLMTKGSPVRRCIVIRIYQSGDVGFPHRPHTISKVYSIEHQSPDPGMWQYMYTDRSYTKAILRPYKHRETRPRRDTLRIGWALYHSVSRRLCQYSSTLAVRLAIEIEVQAHPTFSMFSVSRGAPSGHSSLCRRPCP